jgi:hypothetical protein
MKTEKEAAVSQKTEETKTNIVANVEFTVRASLREEYVDADFVHSISGRVLVKCEDLRDEEDAGYIKASLVQFGEAMDHGISTERLEETASGEALRNTGNSCSIWKPVTGERKYKTNTRLPDATC